MSLREEGYWHEHYTLELRNYQDSGDEGQVWFGRALSRKIVAWLADKLVDRCRNKQQLSKVIDIGCGNGFLLLNLMENCKTAQLNPADHSNCLQAVGVDYAEQSIELSKKIIESHGFAGAVQLMTCDFLDLNQVSGLLKTGAECSSKFNFLIDVGTYDAICLLADKAESDGARLQEAQLKYLDSLYVLAEPSATFILASCNHTEEELMSLFTPQFQSSTSCSRQRQEIICCKLLDRIDTPKLQFGGVQGSQVTCLILELNFIKLDLSI